VWKDERMVEAGKKAHLTKLRNQGRQREAEEYMKQMGIKKGAETLTGTISRQIAEQTTKTKAVKVKYDVPVEFNPVAGLPWVEKYRPISLTFLSGAVGPYLRAFVKTDSIPLALVFWGDYGQGKTAGAGALVRDYYVMRGVFKAEATFKDVINGSKWTSTYEGCWPPVLYVDLAQLKFDVEMVREKVMLFMRVRSMWNPMGLKLKKYVIFDEADRLSYAAQGALRSLLERYPGTVTIYTTNRIESIDPAIISRASGGIFEFKKPSAEELETLLEWVLHCEGLKLKKKTIEEIAVASVSARDAVGKLQQECALVMANV